jgi:predicted Ser/Thr protein kinase
MSSKLLAKVPFPAGRAPTALPAEKESDGHRMHTREYADEVWVRYAKGKNSLCQIWRKAGGEMMRLREIMCQNTSGGTPGHGLLTTSALDRFASRFAGATLGDIMDVLNAPYFVGDIGAAEASQVLASKAEGTFLIRFSSEIGSYALSALHNGEAGHWRISRSRDRSHGHGALTLDDAVFDNLAHLIKVHRGTPLHHSSSAQGVVLKYPLPSVDAVRCDTCSQYVPRRAFADHRDSCSEGQTAPQTTYGNLNDVWAQSGHDPSKRRSGDSSSSSSSHHSEKTDKRKSSLLGFGGGKREKGGKGSSLGRSSAPHSTQVSQSQSQDPTYVTMAPPSQSQSQSRQGDDSVINNNNYASVGSMVSGHSSAASPSPSARNSGTTTTTTTTVLCLAYLNRGKPKKLRLACAPTVPSLQSSILHGLGIDHIDITSTADMSSVTFLYQDPDFGEEWVEFPSDDDFGDLPVQKLKVKVLTPDYHAGSGVGSVRARRQNKTSETDTAAMRAAAAAGGGKLNIEEVVFGTEELGKGQFGVVLAGKFRGFDVAIKTTNTSNTNTNALAEFRKECDILVSLPKHPNLVAFFGWCERLSDGQQFMLLERVWGGSLNNFIKEKTFSNDQLLGIMSDIASGMEALHANNIIHRDLAMRNVLMTQDMRAKLTDFGLSRKIDAESESEYATREETMLPLKHMAPEALATGRFSKANDTWAYGVVVWTMFSGHDPYAFLGRQQVAIAVRDQQVELSALPPTTPPVVREVVQDCQQYDPGARPTFAQIRSKLEECADF